jgi:hypothetical protein
MSIKIGIHNIAKRHFAGEGAGTLVVRDAEALFYAAVRNELEKNLHHKVGAISIPTNCVTAAFTPLADVDPDDIRATISRGSVEAFVPRTKYSACPVVSASAIVYSKEAIMEDPEWDGVVPEDDFIIVAILANVGEGPDPLSDHRFAANLGGGNNKYLSEDYTIEMARREAFEVKEFSEKYIKLG